MTVIQLGVGTHPVRMDIVLRAGEPFEQLIPVTDATGLDLDQTAWTVTHAVRAPGSTQALGALTVTHDALGLILSATSVQTAAWAETWPLYAPWFIRSTHPTGAPLFSAAGWLSLYR